MPTKVRFLAMVAVGLMAGLALALLVVNKGEPEASSATPSMAKMTPFQASIFTPDESLSALTPEKVTLTAGERIDDRVRIVIETVTDPTRSKGLFPDGMNPHQLFVLGDTLILGYGAQFGENFSGGAAQELMGVDALVNSLVQSFDQIQQVRIVREGGEVFIRHVDVTEPFVFSDQFVAPPSEERPSSEAARLGEAEAEK